MATDLEYAQFSARVYAATQANRISVPNGWTEIISIPDNEVGFSAGVFRRGNEIVIAYTGTNEAADWGWANLIVAAGGPSPQVLNAMALYIGTKRYNPDTNITFTGHSLGGGLASMMAVFFDRPATVFDHAPFEFGARNPNTLSGYRRSLERLGLSDSAFSSYLAATPDLFTAREAAVRGISLKGEALEAGRNLWPTIVGTTLPPVDPGSPIGVSAKTLHSMTLLSSVMSSTSFATALRDHPQLIGLLFDASLYARDSKTSTKPDILTKLYREQVSEVSIPLLDRFAADVQLLKADDGTAVLAPIKSALIVAAMEYYRFNEPANATALLRRTGDSVHLEPDQINLASGDGVLKSGTRFADAIWSLADDAGDVAEARARVASAWHVQIGGASMTWTDSAGRDDAALGGGLPDTLRGGTGNDLLMGMGGADMLDGGSGDDVVVGGTGDDTLDGGAGSDWLFGGEGQDTYRFTGAFGTDTVQDSGGDGVIEVDGSRLAIGKKVQAGVYESASTGWRYAIAGGDLIARRKGSADQILIKHWNADKSLGITLDETVLSAVTSNTFTGDFIKRVDQNIGTAYVVEAGNYAFAGVEAGAADVITGTKDEDRIEGLAGNDALSGFEGDDVVEGGDGDDLLFGGLGRDTLNGGAGRDFIYGSGLGVLTYPRSTTDAPLQSPGPVLTRGFSWLTYDAGLDSNGVSTYQVLGVVDDTLLGDKGNVIDGGAGIDEIRAGSSDDVAHGGADNDDVWGLAGADVLYGDDGDDRLIGDGIDLTGYLETVEGAQHGNDVLSGDAGNDKLFGQGGDDTLYGGDDADILWGDDSNPRATPVVNHGNDYLDGGDGDDQLIGGGRADVLYGGIGNDALYGDDDPSTLAGDLHGDDLLDGGDGNDQLVGGGGDDVLIGGLGNDLLIGDDPRLAAAFAGDDDLDGGAGDDELQGGAGDDLLDGGDGADRLFGEKGDDVLSGDAGDDRMLGGDGDDALDGGDGADLLVGDAGADELYGGDGKDFLAGSDGADELYGEDGDDELQGGADNDVLVGGAGVDWLYGQDGDDVLDGDEGADELTGGAGADRLDGGLGDDRLWGDDGDDLVDGGGGDDQLAGGAGNDTLGGGAGNDTLYGDDGADTLDGSDGTDFLWGDAGNDVLRGGTDNDQLAGGTGNDTLSGDDGNDSLYGEDDDDLLDGGAGDDTLVGGAGNDTLIGGLGTDRLYGGDGDDTYVLEAGDSGSLAQADSIVDTVGNNHLRFGQGLSMAAMTVSFETTTGSTLLKAGSDTVVVNGLTSGGFVDMTFADGSTVGWQTFLGRTLAVPIQKTTTAPNAQLVGGKLDDTMTGSGGGSSFWGGLGSDTMTGSGATNTYVFSRGDGHDTVTELGRGGVGSTVRFGAGIAASNLQLSYTGDRLRIGLDGGTDELALMGFNAANALASIGIGRFVFADGSIVAYADLLAQRGFAIAGGAGNDVVFGTSTADILDGGAGNDTLSGLQGADTYRFGRGAGQDLVADQDPQAGTGDRLALGTGLAAGDLLLTRYRGDLVIRLAGAPADSVRLKDYYVLGSVDAVESIAFADGTPLARADVDAIVQRQAGTPIVGGSGSDTLYGSAVAESIDGGAGDDTLYADAGDDTLAGGPGSDTLYGEGGSDTYLIGAQAGQDFIDEGLAGDVGGVDTVRFVDGIGAADVTFAASGNDLVATSAAQGVALTVKGQFQSSSPANQIERFVFADGTVFSADTVRSTALAGSSLGETITGFGTDDTVSAGRGADTVFGRGGADTLHGDAGNDTLWGEAGDDTLFGDAGDDVLYGGDGNDRLDGGAGLDRLDGGLGNDTYAFGPGRGLEIVVQDTGGVDAVELAAGIVASNVALHRVSSPPAADLAFNGDSLVVQLNGGADQLWIANYYAASNPTAIESIRFADGTTWNAAAIASRLVTVGGTVNTQTGTSKANTFVVDHWNDVISNPSPTAGDKVTATVSYRAPATTPDLTLTGTLDLFAVGTAGLDTLRGNDGANTFEAVDDGYGDALFGGKGDDTYRLRATSEAPASGADPAMIVATRITELAGEGNDTLLSGYWSAQLPANVENLIALAPNEIASLSINFWSENDLMHRYVGTALDNVIDASAYEEGSAGTWWYAKRRSGGLASVGAFRLDGGAGADTLIGERGADTYVIDNQGDTVVELGVTKDGADLSIDTVETPFETSLATAYAHVENVTLTGSAAIGAAGNAGANRLDGSLNGAANRLVGGAGDDTYVVGLGDVVVENAGEGIDTLVVAAAAGTVRLADRPNVENLRLAANAGALDAEGDAGANIVTGSLGDNRLDGGAGDDQLFDQSAADNVFYNGRVAASDRDVMLGGAGNDVLTTWGGDDTLDGGAGDDRLVAQGGSGVNGVAFASTVTVRFGLGDGADTVERRAAALDRFVLRFDDGIELADVRLTAQNNALVVGLADGSSLTFASAVDSNAPPNLLGDFSVALAFGNGLTLEGSDVLSLLRATYASSPTPGADLLVGSAGNDTIDAGAGDDFVLGGAGDDWLDGNIGNDLLQGGDGNDRLFGGSGADSLSGGAGNDLLAGGPGPDTYRFGRGFGQDVVDDRALASGAAGVDDGAIDSVVFDVTVAPADVTVYRAINGSTHTGFVLGLTATGDRVELRNSQMAWTQGAIERVAFADGTAWDTNAMVARVAGEIGSDGGDSLNAPVPGSRLEGRGGSDVITAYSGANILDGGPGEDFMSGGTGDDTFYVDFMYDRVMEQPGGGIDTVISSVDWTLGANVERLRLTGTAPLRGTGNALDNTLIGNAGANRLDGLAGADAMSGGAGDDVYVVDSAGDTVTESDGEGIDSVESLVSFQLGANVENLLLTGTAKTTATGNGLDNVLIGNLAVNTLIGNGGNDRLDGGSGADSMTGGAGDDTYVVDNPSDKTSEVAGGGIDTVETYLSWTLATEVERLVLTDTLAISGTGNASANELVGNVAANVLDGKGGNDLLLGLDGNDTLQDTLGNGAFDGGAGIDVLKGGTGAELFAGGTGNDTLTLGGGADVIAFDRGDGADTVVAPTSTTGAGERNDTLSIGRIRYDQIALAREGNDLLIKATGGTDALRFKDWYLGTTNRTVVRLQVVVDTTTDYTPGSPDVLRNSRTATFDFTALVAAFDAAKSANPALGDWTPTNAALVAARNASADTAIVGGALAYRYAHDATLANVGYATAMSLLGASGFGSAAQTTALAVAETGAATPAGVAAARDASAATRDAAAATSTVESVEKTSTSTSTNAIAALGTGSNRLFTLYPDQDIDDPAGSHATSRLSSFASESLDKAADGTGKASSTMTFVDASTAADATVFVKAATFADDAGLAGAAIVADAASFADAAIEAPAWPTGDRAGAAADSPGAAAPLAAPDATGAGDRFARSSPTPLDAWLAIAAPRFVLETPIAATAGLASLIDGMSTADSPAGSLTAASARATFATSASRGAASPSASTGAPSSIADGIEAAGIDATGTDAVDGDALAAAFADALRRSSSASYGGTGPALDDVVARPPTAPSTTSATSTLSTTASDSASDVAGTEAATAAADEKTPSSNPRALDALADAWFDRDPAPAGSALSHYGAVVASRLRGDRGTNGNGGHDRDAATPASYADQWRHARGAAAGHGWLAADASERWGVGAAAQRAGALFGADLVDGASGAVGIGAGADPVAVARSMAAPLPLFGGLQDGFAKL